MEGNRKVRKPGPWWLRKQAATGPPRVATRLWSSKASRELPRKPQGEVWPCLFCISRSSVLHRKVDVRIGGSQQGLEPFTQVELGCGYWHTVQNSCIFHIYHFLKWHLFMGGMECGGERTACGSWFLLPLGESQGVNKVVRLGGRHLLLSHLTGSRSPIWKNGDLIDTACALVETSRSSHRRTGGWEKARRPCFWSFLISSPCTQQTKVPYFWVSCSEPQQAAQVQYW